MSCVDILSVPVSLVILFFLSLSYTFLPSFRPLPSIRFQLRRALVTSTTYTPSSPQQPSSTTPTAPTTPPTASRRSDSKPIRRPANLLPTSLRPPLPQRRAVQYSTTAAVPTSTEIEIEMDYPSHPLHHPARGSSRPSRRLSTASTSLSTSHLLPSLSPPSANPFSPSSSHALAHSHGGLSLVAAGISTGPHSRFASSGGPTQPPTLHPLPNTHNHLHHQQNPYPTRPSASEIIPNRLYISDLSFAENPALLSSYRITHILSTMPDKIFVPPPSLLPVQPKRMQVCIEDSPFAELASFLPGTTAWIREALGSGSASLPSASTSTPPPSSSSSASGNGTSTTGTANGAYEPRVLVHCAEGISRSVSVVAAYLMATYNWSVDEALLFVKSKRRIAEPNFGFVQQLHEYARDGLGRTNGSGPGMSVMGGASGASSGSALGYGAAGQMNVFSGGPGAGGGGFSSFGAFGQ